MTKKKTSTRDQRLRRHLRRDPFGRLTVAVVDYLQSIGWTALIVGGARIQQQAGERKFNYEFVVKFTGGKQA